MSATVVDRVLQNGAVSSFTFNSAREATLIAGVGMRVMERLSFEFNLNPLPRARFLVGAPFRDVNSDIVSEINTLGWNAKLAAEYAMPIGNWGLKATTRAGFSQSKMKEVYTQKSTNPDSTVSPITERTSTRWTDPFLGIGVRGSLPGGSDNWQLSAMFTRIFTDEESVNRSLSLQLVYNFD